MSYVCLIEIQLHLPDNAGLKGKRKELQSLKAQLQRRFGAAVAETDHHDLWQRSEITAALVGREAAPLRDRAAALERYVVSMFPRAWPWNAFSDPEETSRMADRMRRVNEAVREVVSARIAEGLKDPRIGFVTVTSVDTSPDLRHARVFVSVLGDEQQRSDSLAGLQSAHGLLQREVAADLRMKRTPTLEFVFDDSVERGMRIAELLDDEG